MKKLICVLVSVLLVFCLAACDRPVEDPTDTPVINPEPSDPPAGPSVETPADPAEPADPQEPADPAEPVEPEVPEQTPLSDLPLEIYSGIFRLDEEPGEQMHCLQVFDLGNMLVLEHGLYMDGSLYTFWVEEFWPNDQVEWNDLYDPMPGKSQTFSITTSDTQYDDAPRDCTLRYHDSGIALFYNGGDVVEYYVMDELAVGIHNNMELFQAQLAGSGAPGGEPAGKWYSWNAHTFILVEFNLDGTFQWIFKEIGKPIWVYQGAWTNADGRIMAVCERLGSGGYPYFIEMTWEYNGEKGYLCLQEEEPFLLECFGGTDYFYPTDFASELPFYQGEALQ